MKSYISISCLPAPTFIEGNFVTFKPGDRHPNRDDLPYFVLMLMTQGELFIAEDGENYTVKAGEMFILRPRHHHYSWQPVQQITSYYWLHFYVSGQWGQGSSPISLKPAVQVPTLHYYTPIQTLHLLKHTKLPESKRLIQIVKQLFRESTSSQGFGFWRSQQLFIDILQEIQLHPKEESKLETLSALIQRYLRDNFTEKITNETLAHELHFHPNYVVRALKQTIGLTPAEFLSKYRMEEAEKRLLDSDLSVSAIAENVGFQNVYYFSTSFKKFSGLSPQAYRKAKKFIE
ncbi:helix-turn-helix domain-containing protein [Secundilactobacillus folii]|uniref:Helix-turn-helix domain-containing protein n=1 Tax=Secundilactobacillus folii TaxID=2678357 RepID=A0A7X3C2C3_9LACO|nr:AraC family transcriptional regulator [Secundilactobacillus folii]MTV81672.1 helix-turn-helix domain-containing protein [Secundilactobacillus folii]